MNAIPDCKRLLIIGDNTGNTASRATGAELTGRQVFWSPAHWGWSLPVWRRIWQYRLRQGPDVLRYNLQIVEQARQVRAGLVWVEDPMFIYPSTLQTIRRETSAFLVCAYSDDPRAPQKKSRHFERALHLYDVFFFTKDELVQTYTARGCRYAAKYWKGYAPERIYRRKLSPVDRDAYRASVIFIGHSDFVGGRSLRQAALTALAEAIPGVQVWGSTWGKVKGSPALQRAIHACQLDGEAYALGLSAARLGLQIPSRRARDTHSSRSLEIPAMQTFMLAERTTDHQVLFEEDREAVFFNNIPELVEKARYYLDHDSLREKIARQGYERCLRSGYDNFSRMKQMLAVVERVRLGDWGGPFQPVDRMALR